MIRISCASLNRIVAADGRLLVGLNKNRLRSGIRELTPYGGALVLEDTGVARRLAAELEDPASRDLRLRIDESSVPEFEAWFRTRRGREVDPLRELREELITEERLVSDLGLVDVAFLRVAVSEGVSGRSSATGARTRYYFEVFEVNLTDATWAEIGPRLNEPECHAWLVSAPEIEAGRTGDGTRIGTNCLALLPAG